MDAVMQPPDAALGWSPPTKFKFTQLDVSWKSRRRDQPEILNGSYLKGNLLGGGTCATVNEVLHLKTLERRAAKIFDIERLKAHSNHEEIFRMISNELRIATSLNHPNVVRVFDIFTLNSYGSPKVYMIMEYCAVSVEELMENSLNKKLPLGQSQGYFIGLIDAIEYLHSRGIVHKDVKPQNMLVANSGRLKLADLGVCEFLDRYNASDLCEERYGTIAFRPPETFSSEWEAFSGFKVDIWCAGVTLYNMLTGTLPFECSLLGVHVINKEFTVAKELEDDPLLHDLIRQLLTKCPENRIDIDGIKRHPWLMVELPKDLVTPEPREKSEDKYRSMTVTPYLHELHYPLDSSDNEVMVPDDDYPEFSRRAKIPIVRGNRTRKKRASSFQRRCLRVLGQFSR